MNLCFFDIKNIHLEGGLIECGQELRFCICLIFTFAGVVVSNVLHCVPHNLTTKGLALAREWMLMIESPCDNQHEQHQDQC